MAANDTDKAWPLLHDQGVSGAQGIGVANGATLQKESFTGSGIAALGILTKGDGSRAEAGKKYKAWEQAAGG